MSLVSPVVRALVVLVSACASAASVPVAPAPVAPAATGDLEKAMASLAFYAGTWRCETTEYEAPGSGKKAGPRALVHVRRALADHWYEIEMTIEPTPEAPLGWRTHEFKGFDPATGKWVMVAVLSQPGSWATFGSDGIVDNQMIWTPSKPETPATRGVMIRISDTEYEHVEEQASGKGFLPTWSKRCRKESEI